MPSSSDHLTRRPLTPYEQFFHDDPRRPVSEGKQMFMSTKLDCRRRPLPGDGSALDVTLAAAQQAWLHTSRTWRYLRHVVAASGEPDGDPLLEERGIDHVVAQLGQTVRVFDAAAMAMVPLLADDEQDGIDSASERQDVGIQAEQKRLRCGVGVSTGSVAIAVRSGAADVADLRLTVGVFVAHSCADGATAVSIFRTFLEALDAALSGAAMPAVDAATLAAGTVIAVGERGIPIAKILAGPLELPLPQPDELVLPPLAPTGPSGAAGCRDVWVVSMALSADETAQLLAAAKKAQMSVQAIFSVAAAAATAGLGPSAGRDALLAQAAGGTTRRAGDPAVKVRCFVSVQIRQMCEPPLPANAAVVGGAGMWATSTVAPQMRLAALVRSIGDEIRRGLRAGNPYGFFKMYIPPANPSEPAPPMWRHLQGLSLNAARAASSTTTALTNVGRNACTDADWTRATHSCHSMHDTLMGVVPFAVVTAIAPVLRSHILTLNRQVVMSTSFTLPSYSRSAVKQFQRTTVGVVRLLLRELLLQQAEIGRADEAGVTVADVVRAIMGGVSATELPLLSGSKL